MRTKWSVFLLGLMCCRLAQAQLSVQVELSQDKLLPGESFNPAVRIVNTSGQTLRLGETPDWIKFSIETMDGRPVPQQTELPAKEAFELESTKRATLRLDLAPHFDLRSPGRYRISATVSVPNWNRQLETKPVEFEVVQGTRLWEQEFGVPSAEPGQPPEMRKYALQQANYLRNQLRLYVRVSAGDGTVIKLINAGQMISFSNPEPRLDRTSRLHLLYQNGAKTFEYLVVTPDGTIAVRQLHEYNETRPRLRVEESGEIKVVGGVRVKRNDDLPAELPVEPVKPDGSTNEVKL
jgi:hypothetical protein